ncbi:MAG TPA: PASTA domain-containing protein, partial [Acidimicrobiia bacterium]|nr:PASTA domain-containing protein [Acidimicrobiia bacterium]
KVQLIISSGPEQIRVPNVVGLTRADATTELQNAGFTVTVKDYPDANPNNAGRVASQTPAPNSMATKGSAVTIYVSKFSVNGTTTSSTFP